MRLMRLGSSLVACLFVWGCQYLPESGPDSSVVKDQAISSLRTMNDEPGYEYALVDITQKVIRQIPKVGPTSFYRSFGMRRGSAPEFRAKVGDTLLVSIYWAAGGSLNAPGDSSRPDNNTATKVPPQIVDQSGKISVPFAGDVEVKGLTLREIRHKIESNLAKRALEPQAIVSLPETGTGTVTVLGDAVTTSSAVKLRASGDRILEVIGRSGGIKVQEYETLISLQRGNKRGTIYYPKLVRDPKENIYVQPGDIISVTRYQRKFGAFGALLSLVQTQGLTGQFNFESEHLSLGEALSKTGGLLDSRADAVEVYLYRMEARETLRSIGVDLKPFRSSQRLIPTIYRVNLSDPSGFFLTQRFPMRDKDIIYAANAKSVEVAKFFDHVRTVTGGVAGITGDVYATTHPAHAVGR